MKDEDFVLLNARYAHVGSGKRHKTANNHPAAKNTRHCFKLMKRYCLLRQTESMFL